MSATVPSEMTATAGAILTAAQWNSNVRDAVNFIITPPLFVIRQTTTQSVADSTFTSITFTTEEIDRDAGHSTVTNTSRYTSQTDGYYDIGGVISWAVNSTGRRIGRYTVNGSSVYGSRSDFDTSTVASNSLSMPLPKRYVYLNAGDYLEMQGYQSSGGSLSTISNVELQSMLNGKWVST